MEEMTITPSAEDYLNDLLSSQDDDTNGIKIFVSEPGTPGLKHALLMQKKMKIFLHFVKLTNLSSHFF